MRELLSKYVRNQTNKMSKDRQAWLNPSLAMTGAIDEAVAQTFVIDQGNFHLKIGQVASQEPWLVPNAIGKCKAEKKLHTAHQLDDCSNATSLSFLRPFDKGFCVNWDLQQTILDTALESRDVSFCFVCLIYTFLLLLF